MIRQCLQEEGVDYLEVNLIQEPELIPVLSVCKSVEDLVINLSAVKDHTFKRGETVLFLDEIQEMKAFVFANCNVSKEGKIVYLPIYLSSFVRDDTELPILQPIK